MKPLALMLLLSALLTGQTVEPLATAYGALQAKDYDKAIAGFLAGIAANPGRADIRKDLAYTYLKVGEAEAARDQFGEAMRLDPADAHVALEYAFLCYESHDDAITWKATARRIFDRLRKQGNATAEQAFLNVDRPLAEGIERWTRALQLGSNNFSAHYELAQLAEQRDQLDLAAEHYRQAWKLLPERKSVLVDLGRVELRAGRVEDGYAALLGASRGGETRASERARELLPERYPYVYEFRQALQLDASNVRLHREMAYLLLKMAEGLQGDAQKSRQAEAEEEFRSIVRLAPDDLLSCAQLGFLYLGRKDTANAIPLLERVMKGGDKELANKVRTALHRDPAMESKIQSGEEMQVDARVMAEKSYAAGFMKDALRYLNIAHETDPQDYSVMLQMGYAENMLHNDEAALHWFALATQEPGHVDRGKSEKSIWESAAEPGAREDDSLAFPVLFDAMA